LVNLVGWLCAPAGDKVGYDLAIWAEPAGDFFKPVGGNFNDIRLGCWSNGGIEMDLIGADSLYGFGEFGDLAAISIKMLDTENLKPDLAGVFFSQGTQAVNQTVEGNLVVRTVDSIEGLLVAGV
jgi:hypothetical protein